MTTKRQFTGSNARISYKTEKDGGILRKTPAAGDGTTTTAAVSPAAASVTVATVAGLAAGNIISVGTSENEEILRIKTVTAGAKRLTFDEATLPNFRHESGEPVKKITSIGGFYQIGSVTSFTPRSDRPLESSAAFGTGVRAAAQAVPGRYDFGADLTVEVDIEVLPLWLLHAINDNYVSVGTPVAPAVATTLDGAVEAGGDSVTLTTAANLEAGDFIEIGGKEVVKISALAGTVANFAASNPMGLRYAYADDVAVKKVGAPFTHTITKGKTLPAGLSLLLRLEEDDQHSLVLLTGGRINTLSLGASGSETISTVSLNISCARGQVLSKDIFGAHTAVAHKLYAQWEMDVSAGDADNRFNSLSIEINNNLSSGTPLGSPLPGSPSLGDGVITGSFEYEFRTQGFTVATATGAQRQLVFTWTSIENDGHSLQITIPAAKFGGAAHPPVPGKGPITDSKQFTAVLDPVTNTDIKIVAKTKNPSVEYLTEG